MGGAQVQHFTQVRLDELQIHQTTSEPGADRQAVLSHPDCIRKGDRLSRRWVEGDGETGNETDGERGTQEEEEGND